MTAALRTDRDRAMVALMVHVCLRRCEVLGLRLADVQVGDQRVFVADGKGGHQRLVPVSDVSFRAVATYLVSERPAAWRFWHRTPHADDGCSGDHVFDVL